VLYSRYLGLGLELGLLGVSVSVMGYI